MKEISEIEKLRIQELSLTESVENKKILTEREKDKLHDQNLMKEHFSSFKANPELLRAYIQGMREGKWANSIEYCRTFMPLRFFNKPA